MRLLLIDTCADGASIALADAASVIASIELPARAASASLLTEIRSVLSEVGWSTGQLTGIGVVNGPGSFTGVRVGLSCAQGLCEALCLPLAAVSRLQVLATLAQMTSGYAALNAGRGELFVLDVAEREEFLESVAAFSKRAMGSRVVVAEEQLLANLDGRNAEFHPLSASSSLCLVRQRLEGGGDDITQVDANYVRSEQQIYGKPSSFSNVTA